MVQMVGGVVALDVQMELEDLQNSAYQNKNGKNGSNLIIQIG